MSIAASPDGTSLVTAQPWKVDLWDSTAGKQRWATVSGFSRYAGTPLIAFSADGKIVAAAGGDLAALVRRLFRCSTLETDRRQGTV